MDGTISAADQRRRARAGRFYAVRAVYGHTSLETVERSDDGGAAWSDVSRMPAHSRRSDPTLLSFDPDDVFKPPSLLFPVDAYALLVHPLESDRVFAGLGDGSTSSSADSAGFGGVLASSDGGNSWVDLGLHGQGAVTALALDPDGAYLYAGSQHGIWRLPVVPFPTQENPA